MFANVKLVTTFFLKEKKGEGLQEDLEITGVTVTVINAMVYMAFRGADYDFNGSLVP